MTLNEDYHVTLKVLKETNFAFSLFDNHRYLGGAVR